MTPAERAATDLHEIWLAMRDDASLSGRRGVALEIIAFAYRIGVLSLEQHDLWSLRMDTCPGHDDEGGRSWCAYCGKMAVENG